MAQTVHGRSGGSGGRRMSRTPINITSLRKCWENQWNCWPEGQTVNQKYYLEVLTKLREQVRKKRPELWKKKSWILHQDNVPAHNTLTVKQFLADKCIPGPNHLPPPPPPQFTGFSPLWLLPVPQTEKYVKGNHFQSVDEVKSKLADLLNRVSADDLQHCFEPRKIRMQRCIDGGGRVRWRR
jgi:hypothetical protein